MSEFVFGWLGGMTAMCLAWAVAAFLHGFIGEVVREWKSRHGG